MKNTKDKKFLKNLIMENIQAMKCIKVIFRSENLKKNAGFIIMIIFLIIFVLSGILYFYKGGYKVLDDFIHKSTDDKGLFEILKSSVKIEDNDDKHSKNGDPEKLDVKKFNGEGDSKNPGGNNPKPNNGGSDDEGDEGGEGGGLNKKKKNKKFK